MNYHKFLLILVLTIIIVRSLFAQTTTEQSKSKNAIIDTNITTIEDTKRRRNTNEDGIIVAHKDMKTSEIYKDETFLLSNILSIPLNPYAANTTEEKYVYTYKLIKEQGMVVGIDQTLEMYDEFIYKENLMIGNVQYSQLFFERTVDGEPLWYFAHYLLDNGLQEDEYIERYFVMLQVINPNTNTIAIEKTFEFSPRSSNKYRFKKKFINKMKIMDVLIADDDTIYVNAMFDAEYEKPENYSGDGYFDYEFIQSQLYSIDAERIRLIYATHDNISNLLMDNNKVLYFLRSYYDPRKYLYRNASAINREYGARYVIGITEDEQLWSISCFLFYDYFRELTNGCFDLQLDKNGTLYLLTSASTPSSRNIELYPDSVSTIYTINTNGTGIGGYAKPALRNIKDNRRLLIQQTGRLNDSNVNVRAGYSLQNTVLFQVHEGTMLELRERTKSKYPIGEMEDYWYKGYVLEKDGVTRKTQDGEEVDGWIYGAFLDMLEEAEIQDLERKAEIQKYMMPIIIGIVALLLVGLGVIIIVRTKQKPLRRTNE